jgi:ankyrin repeat protein
MAPIHTAAYSGNLAGVERLVAEDGEPLDVQDERGKTPLMWALGMTQWWCGC